MVYKFVICVVVYKQIKLGCHEFFLKYYTDKKINKTSWKWWSQGSSQHIIERYIRIQIKKMAHNELYNEIDFGLWVRLLKSELKAPSISGIMKQLQNTHNLLFTMIIFIFFFKKIVWTYILYIRSSKKYDRFLSKRLRYCP